MSSIVNLGRRSMGIVRHKGLRKKPPKHIKITIKIPILAMTAHGGARVLVEFANALATAQIDVTIITTRYPWTAPFELNPRVAVQRIGPRTANRTICTVSFLALAPLHMRRSSLVANYFITVLPCVLASKIFGSHYVYLVQDIEHRFFPRMHQWPLRALCRWTYRRGHLVAANSYISEQLSEINEVDLTLALGVSESFLRPVNTEEKHYDIVYFLRAQPHKRIDRFEALLQLIANDGLRVLCVSQDKELLGRFASRTEVVAPADDAELVSLLDRSRVLLLTSEHEGFALPPLEAMARGIPAVLFECGGPGIYAKHDFNALIVNDGNVATARSYILRLLNDPSTYSNMAANARSTAIQFSMATAIAGLIDHLMHNGAPGEQSGTRLRREETRFQSTTATAGPVRPVAISRYSMAKARAGVKNRLLPMIEPPHSLLKTNRALRRVLATTKLRLRQREPDLAEEMVNDVASTGSGT